MTFENFTSTGTRTGSYQTSPTCHNFLSPENCAEREQQVNGPNATDEQCYGTGRTHRAYRWAKSPSGSWNERQKHLYDLGYNGLSIDSK